MNETLKLTNFVHLLAIGGTVLFGYIFSGSRSGFVAEVRSDGTLQMCNEMMSSSPDDNTTPLISVVLFPLLVARLMRFRKPVALAELLAGLLGVLLVWTLVVFTKNCADFWATLTIQKDISFGLFAAFFLGTNLLFLILILKRLIRRE